MAMFFSQRDRERLEMVDTRTTRLEERTETNGKSIEDHVRWCTKLQWTQLVLLIGVCGFLLRIVLKLG